MNSVQLDTSRIHPNSKKKSKFKSIKTLKVITQLCCPIDKDYIFQWIDHGHWYDRKDTSKLELLDVLLVCAISPPGCGRNDVSNR